MVLVTVVVDGNGMMRRATAAGHALGLQKGDNIVCAAVTILLRTAARLLESKNGVDVSGGPGARGEFSLTIESVDQDRVEFVKTTGDYLLRGIRDLQAEFPGECTLQVTERR